MIKFKNFSACGSDYHDALRKGLDELEEYINEFIIDKSIIKDQVLGVKTNFKIETDDDYYASTYYDIDAVLTYWVD